MRACLPRRSRAPHQVQPRPSHRASGGSHIDHPEVNGMAVEEKLIVDAEVTEALPNLLFRVELENGHEVLAHLAGKLRRFRIRINPGDKVRVELSTYDLNRGRIVYRTK